MTRLRVAIDARRLQDRPLGGVGRALDGVIDLLAKEVDIVLVTDGRRGSVNRDLPQVALRPPSRAPEMVWLHWNVRRWLRNFDGVFHGTFNQLPIGVKVPAVVTIHDLSFEEHPEGFGLAKRRVFQFNARYAARHARRIMAPSEFTKRALIRLYGVAESRIVVAPSSVESRFGPHRAEDADRLRRALGIPGPYVVAMGGAPRRGLEVALGAWRRVRRGNLTLVVVGSEPVTEQPGVACLGTVGDDEWATLLAGALAFCYPTRYEGFGVPALESMTSGTPVVSAPVGSLPEVLGDAGEWCEEATSEAVAAGLRHLLDDRVHADDLRARGLARAARHPSWEEVANVLLRTYHEAHFT